MRDDPAWLLEELTEERALVRPLCVDLDGTLVSTDTLWESVRLLLRRRAWLVVLFPRWLLGGRAGFKRAIAERVTLDPSTLPYRAELLASLRATAAKGRPVVLATAADEAVARAVARHLGIFRDVLASDGAWNLKAARKRDRLAARYGATGFDYVGDSAADLAILAVAERGYVVAAPEALARRALRLGAHVRVVSRRPSRWLDLFDAFAP